MDRLSDSQDDETRRDRTEPNDVILNFHGIGTPGRSLDPGEASYWISSERFKEILNTVRDCCGSAADRIRVGITFDDGNASDLTIAAPILARQGFTARFFVLAGRLGQPGSLSAADLIALRDMGFAIGSHGNDHVDWRRLDAAGIERELVTARSVIEAAAGQRIRHAAIPLGRYDRKVLALLRRHGYASAYTSDGGPARGHGFVVPRNSIRSDMSLQAVRDILAGHAPLRRRLRRRLGMLRRRVL